MTLTRTIPKIATYNLKLDKDDELYEKCAHAIIHTNHDDYSLSAITDCGNYSYQWKKTETESFMHLLGRLDEDYLLDKIANRSCFDIRESKIATINNMTDPDIIKQIDRIDNHNSEQEFYHKAENIIGYPEPIEIIRDYPKNAITFAKIFMLYIQPYIKKQIINIEFYKSTLN